MSHDFFKISAESLKVLRNFFGVLPYHLATSGAKLTVQDLTKLVDIIVQKLKLGDVDQDIK
jgi:hypothetical protein